MASQDDDLQASATEGYKIGEKKTVEEYAKLGRPHMLRMARSNEDSFHWISKHMTGFWMLSSIISWLQVVFMKLTIA